MKSFQKVLLIVMSLVLVFTICSCELLDSLMGIAGTTGTSDTTTNNAGNGSPNEGDGTGDGEGGTVTPKPDDGNKPADGNKPEDENKTLAITYVYTDTAGDSLRDVIEVTLGKDETLTLAAFAVTYAKFDSYAASCESGEWSINDVAANGESLLADGDVVNYRATAVSGGGTLRDPENPVPGVGEVVITVHFDDGSSSYWLSIGDELLTLSELYDLYLTDETGFSFAELQEYFDLIKVDGKNATADTPVAAGSIVTVSSTYYADMDPILPGEGEIAVKVYIHELDTAETYDCVTPEGITLAQFVNEYLYSDFDALALMYAWTVDGKSADGNTVLTDGCTVRIIFEPAEGSISITFESVYEGETMFSEPLYVMGPTVTLEELFSLYLDDSESSFADTLLTGVWTVNGTAANADTVIGDGDYVVYTITDIGGGSEDEIGYYVAILFENGDDWVCYDVFVEGTEYLTVAQIYDLYFADAYEMTFEELTQLYTIYVDDVEASGSDVVTDDQEICFAYFDGIYAEAGADETVIYFEYYDSYFECWYGSAAVIPASGVTLKEFHSIYMTAFYLNEIPFEDLVWEIYDDDWSDATADTIISGEIYVWCTDAEDSSSSGGSSEEIPGTGGDDYEDGYYVYYQEIFGDTYTDVSYFVNETGDITLESFFNDHLSYSGFTFEDACALYTFYVDNVEADANTLVGSESTVSAVMNGVEEQLPGDGEMKIYVDYYDYDTDSYSGTAYIIPEGEITLKDFFETYLSEGTPTFEEACADYQWSVNGEPATADTLLSAECEIYAEYLGEALTEPDTPEIYEISLKLIVGNEWVLYLQPIAPVQDMTLATFFESIGMSFDRLSTMYTAWTVNGEAADANTPIPNYSLIVADAGITAAQPEEGYVSVEAIYYDAETYTTYGTLLTVPATGATLGDLVTDMSIGGQSFNMTDYVWLVNYEPATADTVVGEGDIIYIEDVQASEEVAA